MYLCWQGRARNGTVGLAWQMGQVKSSSFELDDLSLENGRRRFFIEDEFRRGRSNNNISCHQHKNYLSSIQCCATIHKPTKIGHQNSKSLSKNENIIMQKKKYTHTQNMECTCSRQIKQFNIVIFLVSNIYKAMHVLCNIGQELGAKSRTYLLQIKNSEFF